MNLLITGAVSEVYPCWTHRVEEIERMSLKVYRIFSTGHYNKLVFTLENNFRSHLFYAKRVILPLKKKS